MCEYLTEYVYACVCACVWLPHVHILVVPQTRWLALALLLL